MPSQSGKQSKFLRKAKPVEEKPLRTAIHQHYVVPDPSKGREWRNMGINPAFINTD